MNQRILELKICRICSTELRNNNWSLAKIKHRNYICRNCSVKKSKEYYIKNKERVKQYYLDNKEKITKQVKLYGTNRNLKLKLQVFEHYSNGTMQCNCCKENHIEFLQIDHINCGHKYHNKKKRDNKITGRGLYRYLINNNFPDGYQVLCANCNFAKGIFSECPHKKEL